MFRVIGANKMRTFREKVRQAIFSLPTPPLRGAISDARRSEEEKDSKRVLDSRKNKRTPRGKRNSSDK